MTITRYSVSGPTLTYRAGLFVRSFNLNVRLLLIILLAGSPLIVQAIEPGKPAPSCDLKKLSDNEVVRLSVPGKVSYVDFWASWCGPCTESIPFLNEIQQQYQAQGLDVIGINLDENREDAESFLIKHPAAITIAQNADGQCPALFGVQAMPSSYLIDRKGKIRHVQLGFHTAETVEIHQKIQALLNEK